MSVALIFAKIVLDPYAISSKGGCYPLFPNHIVELYNVLFSSTLTILLLRIFKIKYSVLNLMVILNIYLVMRGLFFFSTRYCYDFSWFYTAMLSEYCGKVILLYTINLLTLGFLFSED